MSENSHGIGCETFDEADEDDAPTALQVTVIVRQIFAKLDNEDLIQCSLVNKRWNYEARTVLRDLRKSFVFISNESKSVAEFRRCMCRNLRNFNNYLRYSDSSTIIPFNGLALKIVNASHCENCSCDADDKDSHFNGNFENNWNLKYLKINLDFHRRYETDSCSSPGLFLSRILVQNWENLVEITFTSISKNYAKLKKIVPQSYDQVWFPKLRILKFPESYAVSFVPEKFLNYFLSRAPILEEVYLKFSASELKILRNEDAFKIVKNYEFFPYLDSDLNQRFAKVCPKLKTLTAWAPGFWNTNSRDAWDTLGELLKSSRSTLEKVKADSLVLMWLKRSGLGQFKNVRKLWMGIHVGTFEDAGMWGMIQQLEIGAEFPNLATVVVNELIRPRIEFSEIVNNNGDENPIVAVKSVNKLRIEHCFSSLAVPALSTVFPDVTELQVYTSRVLIYDQVWSHWPKLEILKITQVVDYPGFNLDQAFLGFCSSELKELEKLSNAQLVALHTVPGKFSLITMNHLAQLDMTLLLRDLDDSQISEQFFLSSTAAILLAQKMPSLRMRVKCDNEYVVSHLRHIFSLSAHSLTQWSVALETETSHHLSQ